MAKGKGNWAQVPEHKADNNKPDRVVDDVIEKVMAEKKAIMDKLMKFSGEVLTFVYRPHLGFADYAIVKMKLKDGAVESIEELSDPLAAFEARAHMETKQAYNLEKMRRSYPPGFQHV